MPNFNNKHIRFLYIFIVIGALLFLAVWQKSSKADVLEKGIPKARANFSNKNEVESLKSTSLPGTAKASKLTGSWPQFRGAKRDGIADGDELLSTNWSKNGPDKIWTIKVAKGHAGVAIYKGRVFLHDYDEKTKRDVIRCLSFDTGEEIWRVSYPILIKTSHGITRSVPAVNDKYLVTIGPKAQTYCINPDTGKVIWSKSLVMEFGTKVPTWYSAQCPYLDGEDIILAPSGPEALMIKVEAATGKVIWTTPNPLGWTMTHTSIVPMMLDGRQTYIYSASGGIAGIDAETGKLLWDSVKWKVKIAACASPVVIDKDRIFFCGGYGSGSSMMKISKENDSYSIKSIFKFNPKQFGSVHHTPLLYKDHIFGVSPEHHLVCATLDGKIKWTSAGKNKFGNMGPYMIIQNKLYIMDNECNLFLLDIDKDGYKLLSNAKVLPGHDSWGMMAYANGRLIIRDLDTMSCLDLSTNGK